MKRISTKRAKALQIPMKVKKIVYERDKGCCVACGKRGAPNAHYIPRSAGGLGIEENIVTLCYECHEKFDHGDAAAMKDIGDKIKAYLIGKYPNWNENDLVYKKYGGKL